MSERSYRFIIGFFLWGILIYAAYFETLLPIYLFAGFLAFEGLTNLRITRLTNRLARNSHFETYGEDSCQFKIFNKLDSERVLRVVIAIFVVIPLISFHQYTWFLPWFTAGMLIMAGITNICPMAMFLKWSGMK